METLNEITLPETKPAMEWIGDRPVQKMSPTRKQSRLQAAFIRALEDWAGNRGESAPSGVFVPATGESIHPLVPDVAYISYTRLRPLSPRDREAPAIAPEVVVEISLAL